jgi:hypothetical protein
MPLMTERRHEYVGYWSESSNQRELLRLLLLNWLKSTDLLSCRAPVLYAGIILRQRRLNGSISLLAFYDSVKSYDPEEVISFHMPGWLSAHAWLIIPFAKQNQSHIRLEDLTENDTPRVEEIKTVVWEKKLKLLIRHIKLRLQYLDLISFTKSA